MIDPWLIDAIRANDVGRCALAIEFGADITATKLNGLNPLHLAAINKSQAVFEYLLESCGWMERRHDNFVPWSWQEAKRRQHRIPPTVRNANRRVEVALGIYEQKIFSGICSFESIRNSATVGCTSQIQAGAFLGDV